MQSNQIESHLLQSNLISSNLIYLGTAINCGTSILLLKGVGLVENRNTKCIFGGLGGGWGGGAITIELVASMSCKTLGLQKPSPRPS